MTKRISNQEILNPTKEKEIPDDSPYSEVDLNEETTAAKKEGDEIEKEIGDIYGMYDSAEIHILPEDTEPEEIKKIIEASKELEEKIGWRSQQMPSTESMSLGRVKELVQQYLEVIKELVIRLYQNMDYYWDKAILRLNNLIKVSRRVKDEAQQKLGKLKSGDSLTSDRMTFRSIFFYKDQKLDDYQKINTQYTELKENLELIFSQWTEKVLDSGTRVISILENIHPDEIESSMEDCNQITKQLFDGMDNKLRSPISLMGGLTIHFNPDERVANAKGSELSIALMSQNFSAESAESPIDENLKVKIFSLDEIQNLMDSIISVSDFLKGELNNNRFPHLSTNTRRMVSGAGRKYTRMNDLSGENVYADKVNLTYRFGYAYGKWLRTPSMTVATLLTTVSRAVQTLCREMLLEYK